MLKINWVCFGNHSGYSQAAQDMILALHSSGKYDIRVQYIQARSLPQSGISKQRRDLFMQLVEKERTDQHLQVFHCIPPSQVNIAKTERSIGYAMFETYQPPNSGPMDWIRILNTNDAIVTPSLFNYKIFAHERITKPIHYVPCCYDPKQFNTSVAKLESYERFTFLFFGTWKQRKGYPQLIEAFAREFSKADNVQLVVKTSDVEKSKAAVQQILRNLGLDKKDTAPILFEKRVFDDVTLPSFLKSVDCLISPTLGEGFGLPGLQCMALGVPVAITDFSGCKDYATDETCTLIKPSGHVLHPCLDSLPQYASKKWALITVEEVRRVMRYIMDNKAEIRMKAEVANDYVLQRFSYENVEKQFAEMLRATFNGNI